MNLAPKLDRIAARADELRDMLTQGLSGDAYVKASKELADIEPVVARIGDLRAAERAQEDAETLLADPEMRELAEAELRALKERIPTLEHEIRIALLPKDAADERAAILEDAPGGRRRRGGAVRRGSVRRCTSAMRKHEAGAGRSWNTTTRNWAG